MTGFEPWTSGIGSDRSTNWATTTAQSSGNLGTLLMLMLGDLSYSSLPWKLAKVFLAIPSLKKSGAYLLTDYLPKSLGYIQIS